MPCLVMLATAWLAHVLFAPAFARALAGRWGDKILSATRGNVVDAAAFVQLCLCDALVLFSAAILAVLVQRCIARRCVPVPQETNRGWILQAGTGFVLVNVVLALAMHTTLFWCLFWQGDATSNVARFRLKAALLRHDPSPCKAAILGSSQARAQIDEGLLNQLTGPRLHTTELHFPGSTAYDISLVDREINAAHPHVLICYVSEMNFFAGSTTEVAPVFFNFEDLGDLRTLPVAKHLKPGRLAYGLLGDVLPVFRLRDALATRLLGSGLAIIKQRQHDARIRADADATARRLAEAYRLDAGSDFQMKSLAALADRCGQRGQTLGILAGQLSPALSRHIDPRLREEMLSFLRGLRDRHSHVRLLDGLPPHSASDYADLTHVTGQAQAAFTRILAEQLKPLLPTDSPLPN